MNSVNTPVAGKRGEKKEEKKRNANYPFPSLFLLLKFSYSQICRADGIGTTSFSLSFFHLLGIFITVSHTKSTASGGRAL